MGLDKETLDEWSNIYNRITAKGKLRDKLAHSQMFSYKKADGAYNISPYHSPA